MEWCEALSCILGIIQSMKTTKIHSELGRIVGKTRTSERIVEMSGIARLTKSNCFSRTEACMKGSCASNKSLKNARECFAPPSHLRLESERHKFGLLLYESPAETRLTIYCWSQHLSGGPFGQKSEECAIV